MAYVRLFLFRLTQAIYLARDGGAPARGNLTGFLGRLYRPGPRAGERAGTGKKGC